MNLFICFIMLPIPGYNVVTCIGLIFLTHKSLLSLYNLKLTWPPFTLCLLSWCFHVEICIYWRIFMLPRSHFILLISFTKLLFITPDWSVLLDTVQSRSFGYSTRVLTSWDLLSNSEPEAVSSLTLEDITSYRHAQHGKGFPRNSTCWQSRHDNLYDQRNQPLYDMHIHVHTSVQVPFMLD